MLLNHTNRCFPKAVGGRRFISQPLGSVITIHLFIANVFMTLLIETGFHLHNLWPMNLDVTTCTKLKPGSNSPSESYAPFVRLPGITTSGVRSAGELLISQPHCWTHVLVSCTIQLDLVGAKSLISCSALKRPKPLLTVKLARLPPVFLIIARVQTKSLWRAGLKPCDFF